MQSNNDDDTLFMITLILQKSLKWFKSLKLFKSLKV